MDLVYTLFYILVAYFAWALYKFKGADADINIMGKSIKAKNIKNKWYWITGASSGLGEFMTYELVKHGAKVVISARRVEELERVKKACLETIDKKATVIVQKLDMCDRKSHATIVAQVEEKTGGIDCLINNAGRSQRGTIEETELGVYEGLIEVNVLGPISLTKAMLPYFVERKSGHLVAISSVAGKLGAPLQGPYSMSKHAIQGYYNALRMEACETHNIDVTLICPGPVATNSVANSFSSEVGTKVQAPKKGFGKRMTAERFAVLATIAISNKVYETWISSNPGLFFVYMAQYSPGLTAWLGGVAGPARVEAYKKGEDPQNALDGGKIVTAFMRMFQKSKTD